MAGALGSLTHARSVIQPKPFFLLILSRDLQPLTPPYPLHAIVTARAVQQAGDHPISQLVDHFQGHSNGPKADHALISNLNTQVRAIRSSVAMKPYVAKNLVTCTSQSRSSYKQTGAKMPLPTPDQLRQLQRILARAPQSVQGVKQHYGSYDKAMNTLAFLTKEGAIYAAGSAAQSGVTKLSGAATLSVGPVVGGMQAALFPVGAALGPWIGAARIAGQADGVFALHDLREYATRSEGSYYPCSCGKCAEGLQYVIDKKETKIAIGAVSIFTLGLPFAVDKLNSVRKSFQSNRPKERFSRQFVESAKGGCLNAMATIMLLCGKWSQTKPADATQYITAVSCIVADNGWELLKSKW